MSKSLIKQQHQQELTISLDDITIFIKIEYK